MKKICTFILSGFLALNLCGCAAILVGAAAGGGTAAWLSGKLSQQVNAPKEKTVEAVKSSLDSMGLSITSEQSEEKVTRIRSVYTDGRKIWIDVDRLPQDRSRVEIRVGALGDKTASEIILKKISDRIGS